MPPTLIGLSPVAEAGGAEVLLLDVLAHARAQGWDVTLLVLGDGPLTSLARARQVPVVTGPAAGLRDPRALVAAASAVRRLARRSHRPVIHANHPKGHLVAWLGTLGTDAVLSVQLLDPPPADERTAGVVARLPGSRVAIAETTRSAWARRTRRPIDLIPPGVDLTAVRARARQGDRTVTWELAGVRPGPHRYVMVARLQRFKGPFDFLQAAALVAERVDASFLVIGPDAPTEPGVRSALAQEIQALGLEGRVGLTGRVDPDALAATVADATALVHPARNETFGLVLVEALAVGTPVAAYDGPGPGEILSAGGGILVRPGDVAGLADAMVSLARPDAGSAPAPEQVAERFDVRETADRYLERFSRLAGGRT